jgi:hypothetical protein
VVQGTCKDKDSLVWICKKALFRESRVVAALMMMSKLFGLPTVSIREALPSFHYNKFSSRIITKSVITHFNV